MTGAQHDPGYCLFVAQRMLELLPQLRVEVDCIRAGGDIECVHRMRVASRRLRAVLPLFEGCGRRREVARWRREVRAITRALGDARDADVQLAFLASWASGLPGVGTGGGIPSAAPLLSGTRLGASAGTDSPPDQAPAVPTGRLAGFRAWLRRRRLALARDPAPVPTPGSAPGRLDENVPAPQGIECLLLRLEQRRAALQPAVLEALDRLEASGTLEEMAVGLRTLEIRARREGASPRSGPVYAAAHLNGALRCDELRVYAPALPDPARAPEHHAMRIAAKRLRYTVEIFAPLFDDGLRQELKALKRLQDALGELHDCDVWIEQLPRFLEEERERVVAYFGNEGFLRFIEPGIRRFHADRVEERSRLHAAALEIWKELEADRFAERLEERLARARDEAGQPTEKLRRIAEGTETARIALFSDVHGNLPALDAVARDAAARGAQAFINAGDTVGWGGDPGGVVRRLVALGSVDVLGEWDRRVVRASRKQAGASPKEAARIAASMNPAGLAHLASLPGERRFTLRGTRFLVVHRLSSAEGGEITDDVVAGLATSSGADVLITGHTHRPFVRSAGSFLLVNPGSVGEAGPGEGGATMAEYALLQVSPLDISLLRVPYDDPGASPRIEATGNGG
ncbi:MAG: CHAD domain-containing protein [Methanospirillum sp.]|nr:CHAD domain-containing protein [Methanospirillum sp.]